MRKYAFEIISILLFVLPFVSLMVLGVVWIFEGHQTLHWLLTLLAISAVGGLTLKTTLARKPQPKLVLTVNPSYTPAEKEAWRRVQVIAHGLDIRQIDSVDACAALVERVSKDVSTTLNPEKTDAHYEFTAPEALRALSQKSAQLSEYIEKNIPASNLLSIRVLIQLHRNKHWAYFVVDTWKYISLARNIAMPAEGLARILLNNAGEMAGNAGSRRLIENLSKKIVTEIGEAAIELYGGRFKSQAILPPSEPEPLAKPPVVRILLLGQANAGKSTLVNALANMSLAPVQATPTPVGSKEFRISADASEAGEVVLIDYPGFTSATDEKAFVGAALAADCILWVTAATVPGRAPELNARRVIRRVFEERPHLPAPVEILVVSKVDQLNPPREWAPPYDIENGHSMKCINIRNARDAAADVLKFSQHDTVTTAIRDGVAFNIGGLWKRIGDKLPEAEQVALRRFLEKSIWDHARNVGSQMIEGAGQILKNLR